MNKFQYIYSWQNNPKRETFKGRKCRILASGKMGTCMLEFENGEKTITSRRALRKLAAPDTKEGGDA